MSIIKKYRFADVITKDNQSIKDFYGNNFIRAAVDPLSKSNILIGNGQNNPRIEAEGSINQSLEIGLKGEGSLIIFSDTRPGSVILENKNGGFFGIKPNESGSNQFFFKFPDALPTQESTLVADTAGNIKYSLLSDQDLINLRKETHHGSDIVETTSYDSESLVFKQFIEFYNLQHYNQIFLNGVLQVGDVKNSDNLDLLLNYGLDYVIDDKNRLFFIEEDVQDDDILIVCGQTYKDIDLTREVCLGSDFVNSTVFSSVSISYREFDFFFHIENYNQIFLNGVIQVGEIKNSENLNLLLNYELDYVFDEYNNIYFISEDLSNDDIITAFGQEKLIW